MYPLVKENDDAAATQNILLDQMTGEDSPVDKLVGEGNTQDLAQYITGLSTTLNKLKDKENIDKQNLNNTVSSKTQKQRASTSHGMSRKARYAANGGNVAWGAP